MKQASQQLNKDMERLDYPRVTARTNVIAGTVLLIADAIDGDDRFIPT